MKIIYTPGKSWRDNPNKLPDEQNYISLSGNDWDDYGIGKTTLNVLVVINGMPSPVSTGLKLLIEDCKYTSGKLDELCKNGWDGVFPIPEFNYISLPTNIDFYKPLITHFEKKQCIEVLELLRDVGYLQYIKKDKSIKNLTDSPIFSSSLLRDSGSNKAYQDGWRLIEGESSQIRDFELNILTQSLSNVSIPFRFESKLLPYDINVLIGSNGIGKSYCLKSLVEYWLKIGIGQKKILDEQNHVPFNNRPNINRLILISYSPFEEFSLTYTKNDDEIGDESAYKYFGFRQLREDGSVGISRELPKNDASNSLVDAIYEDDKYKKESWWVNKFDTLENAFKGDLEVDRLALRVNPQYMDELKKFPALIENENYLILNKAIPTLYSKEELKKMVFLNEGVHFIKDNQVKTLSSGQRLFSYIAINVVGAIREHSMIVIDEPELFLHPTLEVRFISLLKAVLNPFKSKAILATHSVSVVREVPSNCVHIFKDEGQGLEIVPPPFETFGGGVQRITSFVFGDHAVSKPFDDWLFEQVKTKKDSEKLIRDLGDEINEQLMMKIQRLGRKLSGS